MRRPFLLALVLCLAAASARAQSAEPSVPLLLGHQGRLFDGADQPVTAVQTMRFAIHARHDESPGQPAAPIWSATYQVNVRDGVYAVNLGDGTDTATGGTPLPASAFDGSGERFLGITIGGDPELKPRLRLGATAFAILARRALAADKAGDAERLGGKAAAEYLLATAADAAYQPKGAYLTAAAAEAAYQPKGDFLTSAAAAAAYQAKGDYVTTAAANAAYQPAGSYLTSAQAASTYLTISNADANFMRATGGQITGGLKIGGSLQIANDTAACDAGKAGALRWNNNQLEVCAGQGAGWLPVAATTSADGTGATRAGASCKAIRDAGAARGDGYYWIDPDGTGTVEPFEAWCDMTTDGGGWTLCFSYDNSGYDSSTWPTIGEARNKMLARRWGATKLFGDGQKQGNFCQQIAFSPGLSRLRAEVVTVGGSQPLASGVFMPRKSDFFTQTHNPANGSYDCLTDETRGKRLIYANYLSPSRNYNQHVLGGCSAGAAFDHTSLNVGSQTHAYGIDGILAFSAQASGTDAGAELSLHVNWYGDVGALSLYTTTGAVSLTKFGVPATWNANAYGRTGASPGLHFCQTNCGYTNQVQNVFKTRLWLR